MKFSLKFKMLALLFVCSTALAGCAINPVTGEQQLMLLSEQDESRLGQKTDQSVVNQYGVYQDSVLQNYLQMMGQSMGRNSHRSTLNWQFKVMDAPVVNAFAAPGGYIYVTRGLLAAINDEAELAGVLGHEIGHVTARHSAQQYSNMMMANFGLTLGQGLLGDYSDMLGPVMEKGAGLLFLKFSRDDEREADALGVEYAARAGYDASRMADFFVTLQRQSSVAGKQSARLPEFFSTHPNPVNREATVRAMAAQWQARLPEQKMRINRQAFLRHIDGLVYGDDPRKGFREGNWYYLPQFKVKIPVPGDWKVEQEGNNLQMTPPKGKAATLFSVRLKNSVNKVVTAFLESTGAKVHQQKTSTRAGMSTRLLLSVVSDGKKRAVVVSHFYQKGPDVFVFHSLTDEADYAEMSSLVQGPAKGFATMTDRARLNRQPLRIAVKTVSRSSSLEKTLRGMKINRDLWERIAWLNGRQLTDVLRSGEQIKVVR